MLIYYRKHFFHGAIFFFWLRFFDFSIFRFLVFFCVWRKVYFFAKTLKFGNTMGVDDVYDRVFTIPTCFFRKYRNMTFPKRFTECIYIEIHTCTTPVQMVPQSAFFDPPHPLPGAFRGVFCVKKHCFFDQCVTFFVDSDDKSLGMAFPMGLCWNHRTQ